jgi:hypothetical protein
MLLYPIRTESHVERPHTKAYEIEKATNLISAIACSAFISAAKPGVLALQLATARVKGVAFRNAFDRFFAMLRDRTTEPSGHSSDRFDRCKQDSLRTHQYRSHDLTGTEKKRNVVC